MYCIALQTLWSTAVSSVKTLTTGSVNSRVAALACSPIRVIIKYARVSWALVHRRNKLPPQEQRN